MAFDLEESGLFGSDLFVQNLTQSLNSTGAGFQGAFVLETILNYNNTPNSQMFPPVFQNFFPQAYQQISTNKFRGDFLAVIGRSYDDAKLISGISNAFKKDGKCNFTLILPNFCRFLKAILGTHLRTRRGQTLEHAQRRKFWSPARLFPAQNFKGKPLQQPEIKTLRVICERKQK